MPSVEALQEAVFSADPKSKQYSVLVHGVVKILSLVRQYGDDANEVNSFLVKLYQVQYVAFSVETSIESFNLQIIGDIIY